MDDSGLSPERIRRYVRAKHDDVLRTVGDCADVVTTARGEPIGSDRETVVEPFREALEASGVLATLPAVLADVVEETDHELSAPPAPGPPYVVVTSSGVLLRATLPPGRLIVAMEPFAVSREPTPTYRRRRELTVDVRVA